MVTPAINLCINPSPAGYVNFHSPLSYEFGAVRGEGFSYF
jgi:hypothetical protein